MDERMKLFEEIAARDRLIKIERFKHLNSFAKKGHLVFAGSSLAEQFPINEMLQNYREERLRDIIIYKRGIGGDVTTNLLQDLNLCVLDLEPSKLFINIGTNDMGKPGYLEMTLFDNYRLILQRIVEALPNIELFIMSYYPVNKSASDHLPQEFRDLMFSTRTNENITHANQQLMLLAQEFNATYIDVTTVLLDDDNQLKREYTAEGVHLWPNGYQQVLDILVNYL